jgi:hypothetical protein
VNWNIPIPFTNNQSIGSSDPVETFVKNVPIRPEWIPILRSLHGNGFVKPPTSKWSRSMRYSSSSENKIPEEQNFLRVSALLLHSVLLI